MFRQPVETFAILPLLTRAYHLLKSKGGLTPRVNSPYGRDSLVSFAPQGTTLTDSLYNGLCNFKSGEDEDDG